MDVFDLAAKITLDKSDYEKGLNEAGSKLQALGGKISSGLKTAAAVGAAAVGAAATAVGGLVVKSVQAYADYEQMVGGVQKLYGNMGMSLEEYAKAQGKTTAEVKDQWQNLEEAQNMVLKNADNAYKTAGMSANKYMEVATSFSASLINSLGGDSKKAAEMTDVAMVAIADNWNTFGGDLGMIQGAFQGFAKQNYTMLDNLKLGYGGTKSEMERLIKDANEYAKSIGQAGDLTIESFADIVSAIDLVQQKQNIAGTTAREASTTISGSLGMVKAAWENLVTGMSNKEADLEKLMSNLTDSIVGYTDSTGKHVNGLIDNILPVAEQALASVGTFIERLAPKIAEEIPKLVDTALPPLLSAGANIVSALVQGIWNSLPGLLKMARDLMSQFATALYQYDFAGAAQSFGEKITSLFDPENGAGAGVIHQGIRIVENLISGIASALPELMSTGATLVSQLAEIISQNAPSFISTAADLIVAFIEGISSNIDSVVESALTVIEAVAKGINNNLPKIIEAGVSLITKLVETLSNPDNLSKLLDTGLTIIMTLFEALVDNADELMEAAVTLIENLIQFFSDNVDKVIDTAILILDTLIGGFLDNIDVLIDLAIELIMALAEGLISALPKLIEKAPVIIEKLVDAIIRNAPKLIVAAGELIGKLLTGIIQALPKLLEAGMKIATELVTGIARFAIKIYEAGKEMVDKIWDGLKSLDPIQWGKDMIDSFISGIKDRIHKVAEAAKDIAGTIKDILGFSEPEEGPLSNFHTYAPDMMNLFIKGIKDNEKRLQDQVAKTFDFGDMTVSASPTINASGAGMAGGTNNMTINVYGAEGQDVKELADVIQDRILHMMNQTGAVYA